MQQETAPKALHSRFVSAGRRPATAHASCSPDRPRPKGKPSRHKSVVHASDCRDGSPGRVYDEQENRAPGDTMMDPTAAAVKDRGRDSRHSSPERQAYVSVEDHEERMKALHRMEAPRCLVILHICHVSLTPTYADRLCIPPVMRVPACAPRQSTPYRGNLEGITNTSGIGSPPGITPSQRVLS